MELVPDGRAERRVRLRQVDRAAEPVPEATQLHGRALPPERSEGRPAYLLRHVAHRAPRCTIRSRAPINSVGLDQVVALHTKQHCRQPSLVLSIDAGTGFLSRTGTISYSLEGRPIPAENNPRRIFDRLFRGDRASLQSERDKLAAAHQAGGCRRRERAFTRSATRQDPTASGWIST